MLLVKLIEFLDMNNVNKGYRDVEELCRMYNKADEVTNHILSYDTPIDTKGVPMRTKGPYKYFWFLGNYFFLKDGVGIANVHSGTVNPAIVEIPESDVREEHKCLTFKSEKEGILYLVLTDYAKTIYHRCKHCHMYTSEGFCSHCKDLDLVQCPDCGRWIERSEAEEYEDCLYCESCMTECEECGERFPRGIIDRGNIYLCDDCLEDYRECDDCGNYHHISAMYYEGNNAYCEDCVTCCDCCGEYHHIMHGISGNREVCEDCWNNNVCCCDECGRYFLEDEVEWTDDDRCLCDSCYENCSGTVRSYHCNPSLVKHYAEDEEEHNCLIGCEIETEEGNYDERKEITKRYGKDERYIYQMRDSSLNSDGIECITQPMSKKFFDQFNFEDWMQELKDVGARSHDTDNCGLHIHLSRKWFANNDDDIEFLVGKARLFMLNNRPCCERFARRSGNSYCEYITPDDAEIEANDKDKVKKFGKKGDRYTTCHITERTVEFRIFRGTLNPETFRASVEFCLRLVDFIKTDEPLEWTRFIEYKEIPQALKSYLERRELLCA